MIFLEIPRKKRQMQYKTKFPVAVWLLSVLFWSACAYVACYGHQRLRDLAPARIKVISGKDLDTWYRAYNSEYFNDNLPKDAVLDWGEYDPDRMASTSRLPDGRFHVAFNEKYCLAGRVMHIVLLHEQCHIQTFSEKTDHGPRWRTCMLNLYQQDAFKKDLIDGIE
jgi:hypothetical protein